MKLTKKLITTFLTLALLLGCISCATPAQAASKVPKTLTSYLTHTGLDYEEGMCIDGWHKIPSTSVKSSNNNILQIRNVVPEVLGKGGKYSYIGFNVKKPGTAAISFKMDGKKYRTKVIVKKYVNPIKSLSITGIKNGNKTNLASLSDKTPIPSKVGLKKTVKNPKIKIEAKNGWKIQSIFYRRADDRESGGKDYKKPVAKTTIKIFPKTKTLKKNAGGYSVSIGLVNTKNNATIYLSYNIDTVTD